MNTSHSLDSDALKGSFLAKETGSSYPKYLMWIGLAVLLAILLFVIWFTNNELSSGPNIDANSIAREKENLANGQSKQLAPTLTDAASKSGAISEEGTTSQLGSTPSVNDASNSLPVASVSTELNKKIDSIVNNSLPTSAGNGSSEKTKKYLSPSLISLSSVDEGDSPINVMSSDAVQTFFFKKASRKVNPLSKVEIKKLVGFVNKCRTRIIIIGHTCILGTAEYNNQLGLERAGTVKRQLIREGANPRIITIRSEGLINPIADNDTRLGKSSNRRVELFCSTS